MPDFLNCQRHMHLFKKWSKYAFAYASMQMHNYPKPSYNREAIILLFQTNYKLLQQLFKRIRGKAIDIFKINFKLKLIIIN